jgi:hypothetical protein
MAVQVLANASAWIDGLDIQSNLNQIQLGVTADQLDASTFGNNGWRNFAAGLKNTTAQYDGYTDYPAPDSNIFSALGTSGQIMTITPSGTFADIAYSFQAATLSYQRSGKVGELEGFTVNAAGSSLEGCIRGQLAYAKQTATVAAASVLTFTGAVSATQNMYLHYHVFTAGTALTFTVQSAATNFASPTTRTTVTNPAAGGGRVKIAGAITDTFWRINVTAATGSPVFAAALGVAA